MKSSGRSPFVRRRNRLPRRSLVPILPRAAPQAAVILDTFTDLDGVTLANHTPDIAPSSSTWSNSNLGIHANQLHYLNTTNRQIAVIQSGVSDCEITLRCCYDSNGSSSISSEFRSGIIGRYTAPGNFWRIAFHPLSNFGIYEINAGVAVARASTSFASENGAFHTVRATLKGTNFQADLDGEYAISYDLASFNQTATLHGLMIGYSGTVPAADDFRLERA